jgi:hypothetical protein
MSCPEAAIFRHGLPEGTAYGLEVQTSAGDADSRKVVKATGGRSSSPIILMDYYPGTSRKVQDPNFRKFVGSKSPPLTVSLCGHDFG